ncbi:MAG: hypothetical protein ABI837_20930, partial [Acidobacteriota bacterium]
MALNAAAQTDDVARARQLASSGEQAQAISILKQRVAAHPEELEARMLYGTILAETADLEGARREFRAVLQAEPGNLAAILALGRLELRSAHPARAERLAADALVLTPENSELLLLRAKALRALNRRPEARQLVESVLLREPDLAGALALRRRIDSELQGSEMMVMAHYDHYERGLDPWRELQIGARRGTTFGPLLARISHAERFHEHDNLFELE